MDEENKPESVWNRAAATVLSLDITTDSFDYGKARHYVALVKEFVSRARRYLESRRMPLHSPFIGLMSERSDLPQDILDKLDAVSSYRKWPPVCLKTCQTYLTHLFRSHQGSDADEGLIAVYEPLFQLLMEGGDFYQHHGDICVGDVATVILAR
jgi:hypothetical protein